MLRDPWRPWGAEMKEVVVVGGAGDMARVASTRLLDIYKDCRLTLADYDLEKAERAAGKLGDRVSAVFTDIFDPSALGSVIDGCDLVINCTGPYYRTAKPVIEACIEQGVDYVDMLDDDDAARSCLGLTEKAREKGILALICCGIAPGLLNVLTKQLYDRLDEVDSVDLAWVSGSTPAWERDEPGGAGVIEHMLHCCTGRCVTILNGERVMVPAFRKGHELDFGEPLGRYEVFELGHAETATMPAFLDGISNLRTMGAVHPPYLNGVFLGIARQVEKGSVSMREAVDFLVALDAGEKVKRYRPYLGILTGITHQLFQGGLKLSHLADLVKTTVGRRPSESLGGILVRVSGTKDGRPATFTIRESSAQSSGLGGIDVDDITGLCCAVFASMILEGRIEATGVVSPEACVEPDAYIERMRSIVPEFNMEAE